MDLLHPLTLTALGLLILNDHLLKGLAPGWLTGKLSDGAGLLLVPVLLRHLTRVPLGHGAFITTVAFALVKVWPPATAVYTTGMGWLQAPLQWAWGGVPGPVVLVPDATDLWMTPAAWGPWALERLSQASGTDRVQSRSGGTSPMTGAAFVVNHPQTAYTSTTCPEASCGPSSPRSSASSSRTAAPAPPASTLSRTPLPSSSSGSTQR